MSESDSVKSLRDWAHELRTVDMPEPYKWMAVEYEEIADEIMALRALLRQTRDFVACELQLLVRYHHRLVFTSDDGSAEALLPAAQQEAERLRGLLVAINLALPDTGGAG